jgi:hypothetical protein
MNSLVQVAAVCLLLFTSLTVYSPIINSYFVADDFGYVGLYIRQQLVDVPRLFTADWSQGIGTQNTTFKNPESLIENWEALWKPHVKP